MFSYFPSRSLPRVGKQLKPFSTLSRGLSSANETDAHRNAQPETTPGAISNPESSSKPEQPQEPPMHEWAERIDSVQRNARLPRSVQAVYLRPLRRRAEYGLPVCDLQLRSYSVRNVEFFADFATRAAYYLKLPLSGPVPLPRIVERWTMPRGHFAHKKTQENFERVTLRRLLQIKDGNLQAVQTWLAFLRKHAFYGVGMKANVWEHESIDVRKSMDEAVPEIEKSLEPQFGQFGQRKDSKLDTSIFDTLDSERFTQSESPLTEVREGNKS